MRAQFLNNRTALRCLEVASHPRTLLPPPDDAGAVALERGTYLFKIDGFAMSRALYPWCSLYDFGYRGVCAAVSDVIAKGCIPYIAMISIGLPASQRDEVDSVVQGAVDAARAFRMWIENIDTNAGDDGWIDVAIVAYCPSTPIPRYARPGYAVVIADRVGLGATAYISHVLGRPPPPDAARYACRPDRALKLLDLAPSLRFLGVRGSIDISDTLYEALVQLLDRDRTGLYIDADLGEVMHVESLALAKELGLDPLDVFISTAEEYIPIFVVDPSYVEDLISALRRAGLDPQFLGYVTHSASITYRGIGIRQVKWNHFTKTIELHSLRR